MLCIIVFLTGTIPDVTFHRQILGPMTCEKAIALSAKANDDEDKSAWPIDDHAIMTYVIPMWGQTIARNNP